MTQEQEFEFRARAEAEQAAAVPRSSLADRAAMREAQARNARVMRIIPGTGFLSPEKGLRSNQQSQALLQGLSYNTSDEMASALAAARTGISNLRGRSPGFSARESYDARMRQEREHLRRRGQRNDEQTWEALGLQCQARRGRRGPVRRNRRLHRYRRWGCRSIQ